MHSCTDFGVSDVLARRPNPFSTLDARAKLGFVLISLAINLVSPNILAPAGIAAFCLGMLLLTGVPARLLALRLTMPLAMATVIVLTRTFLDGSSPAFVVGVGPLSMTAYDEGLRAGILTACRVLSGVSLVLLLTLSTPIEQLLAAAAWFRAPRLFIQLCLLVYRYVFVLSEELYTMRNALRVRLGFLGWRQSMRSLASLGAFVVLRACDRAPGVMDAMSLRGYAPGSHGYTPPFQPISGRAAVALVLTLICFSLLGATA